MRDDVTRLRGALTRLKVPLDDRAIECLLNYAHLLQKWNRVYNLTAIRDPGDILVYHLLDSLAVLPWISGPRWADIGSGGGLPGIPLAIALPGTVFHLIESNQKKATFLQQATIELGLKNVAVHPCRAEAVTLEHTLNGAVTRAVSDLAELIAMAVPLLRHGGTLLAMKGQYPAAELQALGPRQRQVTVHQLAVPDLDAERHLISFPIPAKT